MASREFKLTVKTVSKNFQKYTQAMESDIQNLIASMLDVIEMKIVALRKLLKLKLCIKNVRSIADLETNLEDISLNQTYTYNTKKEGKGGCNSLDDLSSMIYEVDKNSLPIEDDYNSIAEDEEQKKLKLMDEIADLESLCSALNRRNSKLNTRHKEDLYDQPLKALDKYIYLLLDAERQRELNKAKEIERTKDTQTPKIGDGATQLKNNPSEESVVYLGKADYDSILNILQTVLKFYKKQDEISKTTKPIEKAKTEPMIGPYSGQTGGRKIVSDSTCQKDISTVERRLKNRKNCCIATNLTFQNNVTKNNV